ncbi:MAG: hypothetical protein AB7I30_02295 [Isosphaeraceae bacterium]
MRVPRICLSLAVISSLGLSTPASADLAFITVDVAGTDSTALEGINDDGTSVGSASTSGFSEGFIRNSVGVITRFNVFGGFSTYAKGVNNAGTVTGYFNTGGNTFGYYREVNGTVIPFSVPGSVSTFANGINDNGFIVGTYSMIPGLDFHGFVRAPDGTFATFDVPGALWTFGEGINSNGEVVGNFFDGFALRAFTVTPAGFFNVLSVPNSDTTLSGGLNNLGTVVGSSLTGASSSGGPFFFSLGFVGPGTGPYTTFTVPGSVSTYAEGINNAGVIVGSYTTITGASRGFIAVPEPHPFMLCGGLLALSALVQSLRTRWSAVSRR